jgi:hypothetical protein
LFRQTDRQAHYLYSIDKYNGYVRALGGVYGIGACSQTRRKNHVGEMTDDTLLFVYLTIPENEEWTNMLFHFIQDIVCCKYYHHFLLSVFILTQIKKQAEMMEKLFDVLKSDPKRSCFIPEELREISPLAVSSEECIVGGGEVR